MRDVFRGSANYCIWSIGKIQLTYQLKNGYYSQSAFSEHVHIIAIIDKFLGIIIIANILLKWLICDTLANSVPLYNFKKNIHGGLILFESSVGIFPFFWIVQMVPNLANRLIYPIKVSFCRDSVLWGHKV